MASTHEDQGEDMDIDATSRLKSQATRRKGRGFDASKTPSTAREGFERGNFAADASADSQAQRSVEGYIVLLTNLHEETTEEDVQDAFAAFGQVRNMHLNLDRRTGYVKGYALLEYATFDEAEVARLQGNGLNLLGNVVAADWAFVRGPLGSRPRREITIAGRAREDAPLATADRRDMRASARGLRSTRV